MSEPLDAFTAIQTALREVLGPNAELPRKLAAEVLRERLRRRGVLLFLEGDSLRWRLENRYVDLPTEAERAVVLWLKPELIALLRNPPPAPSAGKPRRRRRPEGA